ncbi:hypothetical protein T484DRAFT_1897336, partial [Baffinella frigidus]
MEGVSLLPLAAVVCSLGTIATSCGLATHYNHVPAYPQISMCGMLPPEKYVFSIGMTVAAMLLSAMMVVNHFRSEKLRGAAQPGAWAYLAGVHLGLSLILRADGAWAYLAGAHLGLGVSSTICLALMATKLILAGAHLGLGISSIICLLRMATAIVAWWGGMLFAVPVSEFPAPHVLFAVFFFALIILFQLLASAARLRDLFSDPKEIWKGVFMVLTLVGFVGWQSTGSSIAQYVAVASVMLHFAPYLFELRDTSLHLSVEGAGDAEQNSLLRDAWG